MNTLMPYALATIGIGLCLLPFIGLSFFLAGVLLGLVGFMTGTLFPED